MYSARLFTLTFYRTMYKAGQIKAALMLTVYSLLSWAVQIDPLLHYVLDRTNNIHHLPHHAPRTAVHIQPHPHHLLGRAVHIFLSSSACTRQGCSRLFSFSLCILQSGNIHTLYTMYLIGLFIFTLFLPTLQVCCSYSASSVP
jgi:hypothetical protein